MVGGKKVRNDEAADPVVRLAGHLYTLTWYESLGDRIQPEITRPFLEGHCPQQIE